MWQQTHAPVLILDAPEKSTSEWRVGYLYGLLGHRMTLTCGRQGPVLVDFSALPVWEEWPRIDSECGTGFRE